MVEPISIDGLTLASALMFQANWSGAVCGGCRAIVVMAVDNALNGPERRQVLLSALAHRGWVVMAKAVACPHCLATRRAFLILEKTLRHHQPEIIAQIEAGLAELDAAYEDRADRLAIRIEARGS